MAGYLADVRKAKNYAEFKKMHPDVGITREGFLDLKRGGRTISNTDRRKVNEKLKKMTREGAKNISKIDRTRVEEISDKTISNTDRRNVNEMLKKMTGEGAKNISSINKSQAEEIMGSYEKYMNRHDGGMAKKTRTF